MQPPAAPRTSYKPRRRRWPVVVAILVILVGAYFLLHKKGATDQNAKRSQAPVAVATVQRKDMPVYLTGLGTVAAYNTVTVHTQVDGQLMAIRYHEGQDVKAGDVLAQIDPRIFQAQYDQAVATKAKDEAGLANARLDLKRYASMGNSVSRQILDTQRATVKADEAIVAADQANINNFKTQLGYTTITSPISGRTGIRQVDVGNVVHPGDTNGIVVITQLTPISVIFSLPQQQITALNSQQAGGKLRVDALAADNKTVIDSGVLELVDNEIDQTTGTIKLKATLPNTSHQLWPGGFTNVRLLLAIRPAALVIPTVAVQHGPQGAYVFLYDAASGTVKVQPVTVAMAVDQESVIDSGLDDGAEVVTDGMAKLQDGSKVSLAQANTPPAAAAPANAASAPVAAAAAQAATPGKKKHRHQQGS